jgi:hypothetical protein
MVFSGIPQVAEILALPALARHYLLEAGVPKYFFYRDYETDPTLSVIQVAGHSAMVRFGSDSRGIIAIDAEGSVLHVSDRWRLKVTYINATIEKFTDTARLLAERFPYGARHWFDDSGIAADAIEEIIDSVDAAAGIAGSYWPDFAKEVGGLMYSLDEIQQWDRARISESPVDGTDGRNAGPDG